MSSAVVSVGHFYLWFRTNKNGLKSSDRLWRHSEYIFMQALVIFPRVHVTRNVRRRYGDAPHPLAMRCEQRAQALCGIETYQLIAISQINQDRVSAAACVLRLNQRSAAFPFVDQDLDDFGRHGWMIYQCNHQRLGLAAECFDAESDRRAHLAVRIGISCEANLRMF